jgi:hypothetical protein
VWSNRKAIRELATSQWSKDLARTHITTLGAEEVANMPFCSTSNNYLAFDGCLAALATRAEELMEI